MPHAGDEEPRGGGAVSSRATAAATGYRCARPGAYAHLMTRRDRPLAWTSIDRSSPEKWDKSVQTHRDFFWDEENGKLPKSDVPMAWCSR